ncbi:MAG: 5'-nucleotidase, lipoprotein e(P4) family [Bacteroidetes bacterium]|nr:MAG: 5'-nucleotidase, lipoprotein e(P4) family [Bacteroidota bacterium]
MKKLLLSCTFILMISMLVAQNNTCTDSCEFKMKEYPILFQQRAAEYRALCYQAFNLAALRLSMLPKTNTRRAIITDLDETILDNSYQQAELIVNNQPYTGKSWKEWTDKSAATGVPGAVEFLQKAKQKGITIFYISNRDTTEVKSTLLNLQKLKLPNADAAHMLFLSGTSSKEARRQLVMKKYNVVMLLGDNLNDFMQAFEKKNITDRFAETDKVKAEWGKKFIVIPNAAYGEWENAIYDYERNLSPEQKEAKRKEKIILPPGE